MIVSEDRFSIDGSDSDSSDDAGQDDGGADSGDEAAESISGGNDESRRAHKQKMLALSELMRATTTEMPEFDADEDENGVEQSFDGFDASAHVPARLSSSVQLQAGPQRRSSAGARLSSVDKSAGEIEGRPTESARFGSLERRELRPNERASLAGSGGKQGSGRRGSALRESSGGAGRRLSMGSPLGLFGRQTMVLVQQDAEYGSGHTDINRLVNFE